MSLENDLNVNVGLSQEEKEKRFLQFIKEHDGVTPQDLATFHKVTGIRFGPGDSAGQVIERQSAMGNIVPDNSAGRWRVANKQNK